MLNFFLLNVGIAGRIQQHITYQNIILTHVCNAITFTETIKTICKYKLFRFILLIFEIFQKIFTWNIQILECLLNEKKNPWFPDGQTHWLDINIFIIHQKWSVNKYISRAVSQQKNKMQLENLDNRFCACSLINNIGEKKSHIHINSPLKKYRVKYTQSCMYSYIYLSAALFV